MDLDASIGRTRAGSGDPGPPAAVLVRAFLVWAFVAAGVFVYESEFARHAVEVPATVTRVDVVRAGRGRNGLVTTHYRAGGRDRVTQFRLWWGWTRYRPGTPATVLVSDAMVPHVALDDPLYLHRWSIMTGAGLLMTLAMLPVVRWRMRHSQARRASAPPGFD
ncbi:MAG: hypothetical protein D6760_08140 [Deltaproteobacteria bacterium]|nr:MAG: hypothetical protein D6760_08140 [Deltaproteobacteria bacterium]